MNRVQVVGRRAREETQSEGDGRGGDEEMGTTLEDKHDEGFSSGCNQSRKLTTCLNIARGLQTTGRDK